MFGPGEYIPDPTVGIGRVEDLPRARVLWRSRNYRQLCCPNCGRRAPRRRLIHRVLHEVGDLVCGRPCDIHLTYSQHHCAGCGAYFHAPVSDWALPKSHYTRRVVALAVRLVVEDGLPYRTACWHLWRDHRVFVPFATIQNWIEAGEKRAVPQVATTYLEEALADFSGYVAVDELYDGPFGVLSLVDSRRGRRLGYAVLDHPPQQADVLALFTHFKDQLAARGLILRGITTDGAPLYPAAIAQVFGGVPHQVCQFHMVGDLTLAVLRALATVRKNLKAQLPRLPRAGPPPRKLGWSGASTGSRNTSPSCLPTAIFLCNIV